MLVEMLACKCEDSGILAIHQEESYTSQSSFALGEPIATYGKQATSAGPAAAPTLKAKKEEGVKKNPKTSVPIRKASLGEIRPAQAKGRRIAPPRAKAASKHQFRLPPTALPDLAGRGLGPAWLGIHADANGAANILRKAMPAFRAHSGLSPRFELWWLSPRGLRRFRARSKSPARI